jgi:hypothetical protein
VAGDEPVPCVEEPGRARSSQKAAQRPGESQLDQERHPAVVNPRHGGAVTEDEPPALALHIRGYVGEQPIGVVVFQG